MRLLAFADLHGSTPRGLRLARLAKEADVDGLVCAGDFSNMGGAWEEAIAPLVLSERKLVCVPGNHEPPGLMSRVVQSFPWVIDLDGKGLDLGACWLVGFGAAGLDGEEWEPAPVLAELAELARQAKRVALVTHVPPDGKGRTEQALLRWCEELEPEVVICGHVHRQAGRQWRIGRTRVVCVGWRGEVVTL